ncbi:Retrovirus-related Pol polyprotein from transposon 17.6 [Thelohanellus kitauei]|uniref:Retrovirus-related Pol polyprotein from transposon 17.6 n=1 Tax=Thelohanellus kitauei TaxID=669202 RepID=A0A0C2MAS8_THEKT|nr:Retrovirus-related Pol polyprotein from transposon 17.6 [Thelohanellus kitauei]
MVSQFSALRRVLTYPDPSVDFSVSTDASNKAIGAVLEQNGKVVAYESRVLTKTEENYSTYELESLAIVFALKQFRQYLLGRKFKLFCDHEPLKWVLDNKTRNGRVGRWVLQLLEFDIDIIYRSGSENLSADALSRICNLTEILPLISESEMREAQRNDEEIRIAYHIAKNERIEDQSIIKKK